MATKDCSGFEKSKVYSEIAVILFTAYADVTLAVEGMKIGATDFIVKPFDNNNLSETILGAFGKKRRKENQTSSRKCYGENRQKCSG